jgi:hypothetical protein
LVWFLRQAKKCWISWIHVSILIISNVLAASCCCPHFAGHIGIVVANIPMGATPWWIHHFHHRKYCTATTKSCRKISSPRTINCHKS